VGTYAGVPEADDALADRVVVVHTNDELCHAEAVRQNKVHFAGAGTTAPEAGVLTHAAAVAAAVAAVDWSRIRADAARPVVDAVDDPPVRLERVVARDLRDAGGTEVLEFHPVGIQRRHEVGNLARDVHPQVDGGGGAVFAALHRGLSPAAVVEAGADLVAA